jgi:hypothetical protein
VPLNLTRQWQYKKQKGLINFLNKASTVFGATLATLTGVNAIATMTPQNENFESITIQINEK